MYKKIELIICSVLISIGFLIFVNLTIPETDNNGLYEKNIFLPGWPIITHLVFIGFPSLCKEVHTKIIHNIKKYTKIPTEVCNIVVL